jgi:cytidylate kinase
VQTFNQEVLSLVDTLLLKKVHKNKQHSVSISKSSTIRRSQVQKQRFRNSYFTAIILLNVVDVVMKTLAVMSLIRVLL